MAKPCWFPFYAGDFLASSKVALMEPAEIGAYTLLLCHEWMSDDCSLPNDDEKLKKLSRFSGDLTLIKSCFLEKKGKLINDRLFKEWVKVKLVKDLGSRSGKLGADKRWPKRVTGSCSNPVTGSEQGSMKNPTGNEHSSQSQSQSDSEEEKIKKKISPLPSLKEGKRERGKTMFPEGWKPEQAEMDQWKAHGITDPWVEFATFRDHARTNDRRCKDWGAAWRNWCRKSLRIKEERANGLYQVRR